MIAEIYFSEIVKITSSSETTIIDFKPSKIAGRKVEVAGMRELEAAVDIYVDEAKATGLCGRIYVRKVGRERAISGFNQMNTRGVLVNKHVGEAATDV